MKTKRIFIFLVVLVFVAGCGKGVPFDGAKLYTIYDVKGHFTTTYTYNADGTVATIVQSPGSKTVFEYDGNNVMQNIYGNGGIDISAFISYTKNSAGNADTGQGGDLYTFYSYAFAWDDNSQVTIKKNYVSHVLQSTISYSNVNKNVFETDSLEASNNNHFYDYFTFLPNNSNSLGVQNQGEYFLGASSANLLLTDIKINNNLDTTDIWSYRYRYDGNGFVDTLAVYNRAGELLDSAFYTYY